ncbi:MAG TPA: zinc-binding dehydrogenase [Thermohalobaculum sp.]|nr:zinc-binding dehydrogenase [Thermohalobaculum sp.]
MHAAVCREFGAGFEIEPVELASPREDELVVRIAACAVCHSDLTFASGGWGGALPAVYGHEAAGVVAEVGPRAGFEPGQRVLVTMVRACGACACCSAGLHGNCEAVPRDEPALRDRSGRPVLQGMATAGFAERALIHRSQAVALPDDLPLDLASLIACGVITGYGAVANTARVPAGARVAVIGCGGVGINCIQAARLAHAEPIVAIDLSPERLAQARGFGASHAFSPLEAVEGLRDATAGRGADFVFIAAGVRAAFEQGLSLLAPGGTAVLVGIPPSGIQAEIDPVAFACGSHRLIGSKMHIDLQRDVPLLIEHWRAGRLELDRLVTARFPFERINEAMATAQAGTGLRNVVTFGDRP